MDQHQVIAGMGNDPTLSNADCMMASDGVSIPETLTMARGTHTHLRVFLDILMGRYHPSAHGMDAFIKTLIERET